MTQSGALPAARRRRLPVPPLVLTRLAHGLLWLLVAGAASAGITSLALHAGRGADEAVIQLPVDPAAAEATAEVFLWAYLGDASRGREASVEPFLTESVDLRAVTPGSLYVLRTAVAGSEELAAGYWAVTVAAEVLSAVGGAYEPAGVRYYTIGVAEVPGGMAVSGPPSLVAAPPAAREGPRLAVGTIGRPRAGEELNAAERFLRAYLAGEGELGRYRPRGSSSRPCPHRCTPP